MTVDVLDLSGSLAFVDEMYEQFRADPASVDPSWAAAFGASGAAPANGARARTVVTPPSARPVNGHGRPGAVTMGPLTATATASAWPLVNAYRSRGHLAADLDPLGLVERVSVSELDPATWGFVGADLARTIAPTGVHGLPQALSLIHISEPTRPY